MKSLPVYKLGQWIKSDRNIGYVVARMTNACDWEVRDDCKGRKDVERFVGRGAGYVIQWVEVLNVEGWADGGSSLPFVPHSVIPYRLSWLRAETIAERRYQPCEDPVKAPVQAEPCATADHYVGNDREVEATFRLPSLPSLGFGAPSQPVLPLDIEAATEATMRAAVTLGNQAADWLRAKGLTL